MTARSTSTAATLAMLLGVAPAWAQQADPAAQLDPVTITATKREQDPDKVDAAIGVARPEDLTPRNFRTLNDVDRLFPDVNVRSRSSRAYSNFTVRGQSSVDFYNPTVQVFVDGLPQDQTTFSQLLPQNLERIELLYGPQGTLYGRGAIGGVLNVVTRRPDNELRAGSSLAYGNLERDANAWLSAPLIKDMLYGDIAYSWQKELGEYEQMTTGKRLGDTMDQNGRLRLRYAPTGSPIDIMLSASRDQLRSSEEQFVAKSNWSSRTAFPADSNYRLTTNSFGLNASYDLGWATASSITGYQARKLDRSIFSSYTPEDQNTFTQELRLASDPNQKKKVDYVAGAFFQNLDFERRVPAARQTSKQRIQSYAVFGEATWHVTDRFDVTPGLRFDHEKAKAEAIGTVTMNGNKSYSSVSPKLALGYQVTDNLRAYALYSNGYKAGGFTRTVTPQNIAFTYAPQQSHNGEVGLKARALNDRLQVNASLYYTYTDDYQLFVGPPNIQYLQNVGTVVAKGANLNVTLFPVDALRITAGLGLNDTRFTKYNNPTNPAVNLKDNKVPYAPPVTFNANVDYAIELGGGLGQLIPHAGATYVGKTYFDETNTVGQSAYALFDAGLTWNMNPHMSADAYIDNIADKTYAVYGFNGGPFLGELYQLGQGREFGIRLNLKL